MNSIKKIFAPKEIKLTISIIDEISGDFHGEVSQKIIEFLKKTVLSESKAYLQTLNAGATPRQWVFANLANKAGDFLESGTYHLHRGVLNPLGEGIELLKIYDFAVEELCNMHIIDRKTADMEKETLRNIIKNIG